MPRGPKINNEEFSKYQEAIVADPAYSSLPNKLSTKGEITWVRPSDASRNDWWDVLAKQLGVENRAEAARKIHPKKFGGFKPCAVCGRKLSIFYVYPNENALGRLRSEFPSESFLPFESDVEIIMSSLFDKFPDSALEKLCQVFDVSPEQIGSIRDLQQLVTSSKKFLSPGVMSNAGDRLDGFHTYNACCRKNSDKGRSDANMSRYGQDRRAYENWADGDWRGANRLMSLFSKETRKYACPSCNNLAKLTADHIGPISLGFTHRMKFAPLCGSCNSEKNNRLYFRDVQTLIQDEEAGEIVVSWHSRTIWDMLKGLVTNELEAKYVSVLMRRNLHHVLIILSKILESGHESYLKSKLHPEYAYFDYDFSYFDARTGTFKCIQRPVNSKNSESNAKRYLRVSFESLVEYQQIENRNVKTWSNPKVNQKVESAIAALERSDFPFTDELLNEALEVLAIDALEKFTSRSEILEA